MSLKPMPIPPVPQDTARVAQAIYPDGNIYMKMRDKLGSIFQDEDFADLYPDAGQPTLAPWRLALVTIMQFVEKLSDRQAAEAVRDKISWKYALSLELEDRGFNFSVLSEFRDRLVNGNAMHRLLDIMVKRLRELGLIKVRGRQRTDATRVLAQVRVMRRIEMVGETLRAALNAVAAVEPEWLKSLVSEDWFERYSHRVEDARLPTSTQERQELAETYGRDGYHLLEAIFDPKSPAWLREIPMIQILHTVWLHQFVIMDGLVKWRDVKDTPAAQMRYSSPYEIDAHYGSKRQVDWIGYRLHLTETCDPDLPQLVVNVETTSASPPDHIATMQVHHSLAKNDVLPAEHLMDGGYVTAEYLAACDTQYDVDIIGPVHPNTNWQAREKTGYDSSQFHIDWEQEQVTCPQGKISYKWHQNVDNYGQPVMRAHFSKRDCRPCSTRHLCTKAKIMGRIITMRLPEQHKALLRARARQETEEYKVIYRKRAGVEGTISQAVRRLDLRHCRYRGADKAYLQHTVTAAAVNILRLDDWFNGIKPAQTRVSHFARLAS
ncbi:MAG: IS1182 family transposase [Chloroflexota bacterium]